MTEKRYKCTDCGTKHTDSFEAYYCCTNLDYTEIDQGCAYKCDKCGDFYVDILDAEECCIEE